MVEYIEREALLNEAKKRAKAFSCALIYEAIKEAPAADVVEVIRCKDCKHWNDCCNRDTEKAVDIMMSHTIEDIIQHINFENGRGIEYENADADDISDFGKCLGYSNMPCPNCGRIRLENYENGKQVCEKCQWCPQENAYVDVFALRNEREKNDYFSFYEKDGADNGENV